MSLFSRADLIKDIKKNARSLHIPSGSAQVFAEKTADYVENWLKNRAKVTRSDIDRVVAQKLATFNSDLSFFYQNHGKII